MTHKGKKYEWTDLHESAFQLLKEKLTTAPILPLPEGTEDFMIYCDASRKGFGCLLMQRKKVIAYGSRQLKEFATYFDQKLLNMGQRRRVELLNDYNCEIRYHPSKAKVVIYALSGKEKAKPLRVRALNVTV
ncbi:uncharacterized protein [Rutidosis leptorrhynchoides]|uniref:uncharacterized protein n=1 Tax=Rutidosis leptorrhynchoides TaxID=125765 RepID=UPI003A99D9E2